MKKLLTSLLLVCSATCFADIAVYSGSQVSKEAQGAGVRTTTSSIIQVIDLTSGQLVTVTLSKGGKNRTFTVNAPAEVVITQVGSGKSKTSTVVAQAATETDPNTGETTVSYYDASGINSSVAINGTAKVSLPKNLQGTGGLIITETSGGGSAAGTKTSVKTTLKLQEKLSQDANGAAETLDLAVERVIADLTSKGYVDTTPVVVAPADPATL